MKNIPWIIVTVLIVVCSVCAIGSLQKKNTVLRGKCQEWSDLCNALDKQLTEMEYAIDLQDAAIDLQDAAIRKQEAVIKEGDLALAEMEEAMNAWRRAAELAKDMLDAERSQ